MKNQSTAATTAAAATTTTTFGLCITGLSFEDHSSLGRVTEILTFGINVWDFIRARCPSCHPTNGVTALKQYSNTAMIIHQHLSKLLTDINYFIVNLHTQCSYLATSGSSVCSRCRRWHCSCRCTADASSSHCCISSAHIITEYTDNGH